MGIPRFARWMTGKFRAMLLRGGNGPKEIAALYVDMNGLIHPCCHGESPELANAPEAEKIRRILAALEELVADTNPTTLLYLAMDGVAPRAKMNQQRSRRYSAAADRYPLHFDAPAEQSQAEVDRELAAVAMSLERGAAAAAGGSQEDAAFLGEVPGPDAVSTPKGHAGKKFAPAVDPDAFDSNCISPGTVFMDRVSVELRRYIAQKLEERVAPWDRDMAVVVSDSGCPGEGEHKIIDFMRTNVAQGHLKNVPGAHVIVGLDADLVLLAMGLHCKEVFILRDNDRDRIMQASPTIAVEPLSPHASDNEEDATAGSVSPAEVSQASPNGRVSPPPARQAASPAARAQASGVTPTTATPTTTLAPRRKKLEFFDITIAADLLASELVSLASSLISTDRAAAAAAQPHRLINDFIVLATMLGNDFMPRLPSGFCGDGAMDNFIECYLRAVLPHGFLTTDDGDVDMRALARWLRHYEQVEAVLFRQYMCKERNSTEFVTSGPFPAPTDAIWVDKYRATVGFASDTQRRAACAAYVDGLRFVWRYYSTTSAECSWRWYFAFSHGPLAHDLANYVDSIKFTQPAPLPTQAEAPEPFAQLLCILPPTSCRLLPPPLRRVMVAPPPELQATFPTQWPVDEGGAGGLEHLFTVVLPFADLERLQAEVRRVIANVAPEDAKRNRNSPQVVAFFRSDSRHLSAPPGAEGATPTPSQYKWIRDGILRSAPDAPVAEMHYAEALPAHQSKPRPYTLAAPRFLPQPPKAVLDASAVLPVQRRYAPNGRGLHIVDSLCLALLAGVFVAVLSGSFATALQATALSALAIGLMIFVGVGDDADPGAGIARNVVRDCILDWLCPACSCLNFGRNESCFTCKRPYEHAACPALFSCSIPRNPPNMDPDHTRYLSKAGLEVPGWMHAEAKGLA
jgi:5'-3' exoribonuclease 2